MSPVNTIYLIVTDSSQSLEQQKRKVNYWLELLIAKLRPVDAEEVMGFGKYRWSLLMVSTKVDLVPNKDMLKKCADELYVSTSTLTHTTHHAQTYKISPSANHYAHPSESVHAGTLT